MAKIGIIFGFVLTVIVLQASNAACPVGCTCSATELTCDGLASLPSSSDLFSISTNKATVQTVSITGSAGITEIPVDYFVELPELTTVTLSNNGLTSLNINSFKFLPMLKTIDLGGNPIECEAPIYWVKEWLAAGMGSYTLIGACPDDTTLGAFTDVIDDVIPEKLAFSQEEEIEINEDVGTAPVSVTRTKDTVELRTKVVTKLMEETTSADVQVTETELTFPLAYLYQDIEITVSDNEDINNEDRRFTITVYAESIAVVKAVGLFAIIDNEMALTTPKSNTTTAAGDTDITPTDKKEGGSPAWIIILVVIVIVIIIVVIVFLIKRMQDRKRTTAKDQNVGYAAVKPDGDAKVYSPTTEEVA